MWKRKHPGRAAVDPKCTMRHISFSTHLLSTMIGMKDHWNAVVLRNATNMHGQRHRSNGRRMRILANSLAGIKGTSAVGHLDNDRRLGRLSGFQDSVTRRWAGNKGFAQSQRKMWEKVQWGWKYCNSAVPAMRSLQSETNCSHVQPTKLLGKKKSLVLPRTVHCRNRVAISTSMLKQSQHMISSDHTGGDKVV